MKKKKISIIEEATNRTIKGKIIGTIKSGEITWLKIRWENGVVSQRMTTDVVVMRKND